MATNAQLRLPNHIPINHNANLPCAFRVANQDQNHDEPLQIPLDSLYALEVSELSLDHAAKTYKAERSIKSFGAYHDTSLSMQQHLLRIIVCAAHSNVSCP
eukprot:4046530-Amphidinium_carterae.1